MSVLDNLVTYAFRMDIKIPELPKEIEIGAANAAGTPQNIAGPVMKTGSNIDSQIEVNCSV